MLNDDCLGRTLDWLYAHDPTRLFAGIASQARAIFGVKAQQVHVDTTSFSVSGAYSAKEGEEAATPDAALIAITYGYSRDHRADLKQWMLALATTHDGDVPLFLQPLDGNSSDKVSLPAAVIAIVAQLREAGEEASVFVADNGVYSEANMRSLNQAGVKWISRVSETSTEAKTVLRAGSEQWQHTEDDTVHWFTREMTLPQGAERLSSWCARRQLSSERTPPCSDRSAARRPVGSRSAGIWGSGALPVKPMRRPRWNGN
jgi:transposase